ncbi:TetR/AcrR family transcriptional regulator [Cryptosporangium aurantiacum]|uniref:Transcriptional regulator, TetR family n=1 Tax=Cryptosporangium aurantiacum TaxID=134849 RepID=A0A1M7RP89_9ACTN|nr:TetR/AcrR family transcriptional regulator [Cryptosporangium aurantiacum]SHN47916.1 transcriptional regulator, TetR family [Cryptosporangium aurantiacum]
MSQTGAGKGQRGGDTRERILAAASSELARAGFAGARMESIAQLSGVKKQVIYYYFASKAELARAVLERAHAQSADFYRSFELSSLSEISHAAVEMSTVSEEGVAHLVWEGREHVNPDGLDIPFGPKREEDFRRIIEVVATEQAAGRLRSSLSPEYFGLFAVLVTTAPAALPQLTELVTGRDWRDPVFAQEWNRMIDEILSALRPPGGPTEENDPADR